MFSVEREVAQATPSNSPDKVYAPLQVATPRTVGHSSAVETPSSRPLQIDEAESCESPSTPTVPQKLEKGSDKTVQQKVNLQSSSKEGTPGVVADPPTMDRPFSEFAQELFASQDYSTYHSPPGFSQFIQQPPNETVDSTIPTSIAPGAISGHGENEGLDSFRIASNEVALMANTLPNLSITRQEVLVLSSVLDRIPQTLISGQGVDINQPLSLTVVDDLTPTAMVTTSSQEDVVGSMGAEVVLEGNDQHATSSRGKRRRPRYTLTGSMFKRHPVLKFSATGPLNKEKSPYKWWCRVCRVELSLMSRGSLELISHYRSDSHLVREHRVRMEVPGMPLFDKEEKELLGAALQNAKKKAKDTYPIPPQLDSYRPLVGQESVPNFSAATSPTEKILSQISILEFGLRSGGSVSRLTGMFDELVRLTSSDHLSVQNWNQQRLFVSFIILIFLILSFTYKCSGLIGSLISGPSSLHVPGVKGLLRQSHIFLGTLLIGHTSFNYLYFRDPLFLVRERSTPSLYWWGPPRHALTKKNSLSSSFILEFVRDSSNLCVSHWFWR